jgi:hypothetical protein
MPGDIDSGNLLSRDAKARLCEFVEEGLRSGPGRTLTPEVAEELRKRALARERLTSDQLLATLSKRN